SRSLYSTMSRQAWHDGELRTMASFVYEFVNGRFDSELKGVNAAEREMVKKQPCGNKIWEYLESLQQSTNWDLGFVNHSASSCQTKWSRYLQTRLHTIENLPSFKVLFLYFSLGIKLSKEAIKTVTSQYLAYDLKWTNGILKH
ncbi:hypothetical protein PFISCL1PPCAC_3913, partial [Pristionchus fissidentatus]